MYDGAPVVHKHYDADGKLTGWTEVESPWDDAARAEAEGLYEAEFLICKECGNLLEVCSDPKVTWYPQRTFCYASAVADLKRRQYDAKHDGEPPMYALGPHDGVRIWSSTENLTPDDHFV